MTRLLCSAPVFARRFALAAALVVSALGTVPAQAQQGGLLGGIFGGSSDEQQQAPGRMAQMSGSDLVVRLDQLEARMRQLTGAIEQLQFRNQQLEQSLRRMQEDNEYRFQELGQKGGHAGSGGRPPAASQPMQPPPAAPMAPGRRSEAIEPAPVPGAAPAPALPPVSTTASSGRGGGDVFDPSQHPNAPGAPRMLGAIPPGSNAAPPPVSEESSVGIPGGRAAGAPLDLSSMSNASAPPGERPMAGNGPLPPPPTRYPSSTGTSLASANPGVEPPSQSPKDEFDLGYGYMLRKDYALAEDTFRLFLRKYPSDRLTADAQYWLGESLFQRQRYRDAAESFLTVTTKFESTGKAPDALLRLGQSLAALGEKEAACAALGEVARKYPRAALNVKQSVEREQKRVHC
ncbi:MAG TPA: tol-pal system protein YbgF [Xanthobacteraceae bacterium]|nr:tol-pal system protein YbgF [Xanthobacteraceae bacterium]